MSDRYINPESPSKKFLDTIHLQVLQQAYPDMSGNYYTTPKFPNRKFQGNIARIMLETWDTLNNDDIVRAVVLGLTQKDTTNPIYDYYKTQFSNYPVKSPIITDHLFVNTNHPILINEDGFILTYLGEFLGSVSSIVIDVFTVVNDLQQQKETLAFPRAPQIRDKRRASTEGVALKATKFTELLEITVGRHSYPLDAVSISEIGLTEFPQNLHRFPNLTKLSLTNGTLTHIPASIENLGLLSDLNLSGNTITTVANNIGNLKFLQTLDLSHNELDHVPEGISGLSSLVSLILNSNLITEFPDWLSYDLPNLMLLSLSENYIDKLPESIGNLQDLKFLGLSGNPINYLPHSILQLYQLQEVHLDSTDLNLQTIETLIDTLTNLQVSFNSQWYSSQPFD